MGVVPEGLKYNTQKIELKEDMDLERLYELMKQNADKFPVDFRLKKEIFGKVIVFDIIMKIETRVSVKDRIVKVGHLKKSTKVGIGSMPTLDYKHLNQSINAFKEGGLKKVAFGGREVFTEIYNQMVELLKPYTK